MMPASDQVEGLPVQQAFFCAIRMDTGEVLAIVEARCEAEAADRAAYVVELLRLGPQQEVQVFRTSAFMAGVPAFLESFFRTQRGRGTLH
jgi:hypothetical protein